VPPSERDLDQLMSRLAVGDRAAFEPLFRALYPRALATARRCLDAQAADDAAQSTLMKLFARAPDFARGSPVLPWFYAIAGNEVRAARRRVKPHADVDGLPSLVAGGDPEQAAVEGELRAALGQAIEALDAPAAEAIAAMLGESVRPVLASAAFRKRVSRAYAKLRVLLGGHHER
jgi:RNA polymerase sigma-70 factor (ECF subfamily)